MVAEGLEKKKHHKKHHHHKHHKQEPKEEKAAIDGNIFKLAKIGDFGKTKELVEGGHGVHEVDEMGATALIWAARGNRHRCSFRAKLRDYARSD